MTSTARIKSLLVGTLYISIFAGAVSSFAGDLVAGKEKAKACAACHNADGNSTNPIWPKLAGQHAKYTVKQLRDYQTGTRGNVQMQALAATLTPDDIQDIAAYFAAQKINIGAADPALVTLGERIYRAGDADKNLPACMACHGPDGAGNPLANYPALGGQHAEYTKTQLMAFRDGKRKNDSNRVMRIIVDKMTTAEIEAVSNYIQGLH